MSLIKNNQRPTLTGKCAKNEPSKAQLESLSNLASDKELESKGTTVSWRVKRHHRAKKRPRIGIQPITYRWLAVNDLWLCMPDTDSFCVGRLSCPHLILGIYDYYDNRIIGDSIKTYYKVTRGSTSRGNYFFSNALRGWVWEPLAITLRGARPLFTTKIIRQSWIWLSGFFDYLEQ